VTQRAAGIRSSDLPGADSLAAEIIAPWPSLSHFAIERRRKNDAKRKAFDRALDRLAGEFIGCVVGDRQWIYRLREQSGQ
jgi:hypothetical protein